MRNVKRQELAQDAANQPKKRSWAFLRGLAAFSFVGVLGFAGYLALVHPETPLPRAWNPTEPLRVSDAITPLTTWKLARATATTEACWAALDAPISANLVPDRAENDQCHIRGRVEVTGIGQTLVEPLETRCAIALRMAMWERHSLQPAAAAIMGMRINKIAHVGSYNCRAMRTGAGTTTRMSTHATADAVDITGFRFEDATWVTLLDDWEGTGDKAVFLRAARDGACDWFNLTLSPDYNQLHADHFHLQSVGWGSCR